MILVLNSVIIQLIIDHITSFIIFARMSSVIFHHLYVHHTDVTVWYLQQQKFAESFLRK